MQVLTPLGLQAVVTQPSQWGQPCLQQPMLDHTLGLASSGSGKNPAPMQALGDKDWAFPGVRSRRVGLHTVPESRQLPLLPLPRGGLGECSPYKRQKLGVLGPLDAVDKNVARALLASGGGLTLEDASPATLPCDICFASAVHNRVVYRSLSHHCM